MNLHGQARVRRGACSSPSDGNLGPRPPARRKALGQHHLRSGRSCRALVDFLRLSAGERLLEIGPGGGALTRVLLETGARLAAIELDPSWAFELRRRLRFEARESGVGSSRFEPLIVVADALEIAWERLPRGFKVAGNLPYGVGTVLVERFLAGAPAGTIAAFLLQREVVDRIVAGPGDPHYGALSVLVAARARAVRLGKLPPGAFVPAPKVESAFVGFETVAPPPTLTDLSRFERVVRAGFAMRRKSLRNALAAEFGRERAELALAAAEIDPAWRAERLSVADFGRLERALWPP